MPKAGGSRVASAAGRSSPGRWFSPCRDGPGVGADAAGGLGGIDAPAWAGFAYVSVFSMLVGFVFWYRGLALGGIARVGQLQLLQPFFGLTLAGLLLGETVPLGMVAVTLGVVACVAGARRFAEAESRGEFCVAASRVFPSAVLSRRPCARYRAGLCRRSWPLRAVARRPGRAWRSRRPRPPTGRPRPAGRRRAPARGRRCARRADRPATPGPVAVEDDPDLARPLRMAGAGWRETPRARRSTPASASGCDREA